MSNTPTHLESAKIRDCLRYWAGKAQTVTVRVENFETDELEPMPHCIGLSVTGILDFHYDERETPHSFSVTNKCGDRDATVLFFTTCHVRRVMFSSIHKTRLIVLRKQHC
jgi:hypothetical protein